MPKTVLIVEDNELNMKLFNDLLEAHGYATLKTADGIEAIELARAHHPDLILMDIQLPGGLRARGHQMDQGGRRAEVHSRDRRHRLRDEGRRGAHPGRRLRGLSLEADLRRQIPGDRARLCRRSLSSRRPAHVRSRPRRRRHPINVKLLEAKLSAEYFDVVTALNGPEALAICERGEADIVLLDVMMPGMDGFEVCRRLKSRARRPRISPCVMVTALDQPSDRLKGLDAGADDFLTKPLDDTALFARVRSLVRLKSVTDELRNRALASRRLGIADPLAAAASETGLNGRILLIEDRPLGIGAAVDRALDLSLGRCRGRSASGAGQGGRGRLRGRARQPRPASL